MVGRYVGGWIGGLSRMCDEVVTLMSSKSIVSVGLVVGVRLGIDDGFIVGSEVGGWVEGISRTKSRVSLSFVSPCDMPSHHTAMKMNTQK